MTERIYRHLDWPHEALTAEWMVVWAPIAAIFISAFVAVRAIQRQTKNSLTEKRVDALIECNRRYTDVSDREYEHSSQTDRDPKEKAHIIRTYWSIQYEQWQYYSMGILLVDDLHTWAKVRCKQFATKQTLCDDAISVTWDTVKGYYSHVGNFTHFIDQLDILGNDYKEAFTDNSSSFPDQLSKSIRELITSLRKGPLYKHAPRRVMDETPAPSAADMTAQNQG